ncbi:hypothetical protein THRCLA_00801 [Thraustotheca clavata]|uniref:TRP C-terminal domain-containing protein n=1 Tax=Thraustotheca clavata TaxID=74557 RepID=A0A1W0AAJ2_9STRA|nr:hypothetical protein THRCLA_00801 [Thraustotheca clavata]
MPWKRRPKEKPRDVFGIEVDSECNPDYLGLWLEKIKILTGFFQIFGNFRTTYLIAWPQPINDAMVATSQFSLDLVSIAGIDCFLPSTTYYTQFSTTLVVLAFFLALLLFFYYRGVSYYEAKLNLIPRCCSKCSLPVWDVYTREARVEPPRNRRQSIDNRQKRRRQSLERRSMTLLTAPSHTTNTTHGVVAARRVLTALKTFMAEPDPHTTHARQLQREAIGMSTAKAYTKSLPMYRPTHRVCPAKPLPVHVRDRIMQSNLRVWQARVKLRLNYQTYRIKCHKGAFGIVPDDITSLVCYTYEWSIYAAISFGGIVVWVFGVPFLFWRSIYRARYRHIDARLKLLERREYRPLREKWLLEMRSMLAKEGRCVPSTLRFCDEMMYLGQYMKAKNLEDPTVMNRLGIMYQNCTFISQTYKSEFWWFEVLELIRKVLLNGMLVFLQTHAVKQSIAGLALCFVALFLTLHLKPYQSWTDSLIAGVTLFQLFLTFNCISSINPTNAIINVPMVSSIMVITNLAAVIVAVVTIFQDTYKNHRRVEKLRAERRRQLIRHAVCKLWRRAYNYAVFEAYRTKPSRQSVPFLLEHLRRMRLGTDDETVDLQDFANAFLRL